MNKGYIKIPINEVWEIVNKPHRLFQDIAEEVENLELGEYEYLDFDKETKEEIIERLKGIARTGRIIKDEIEERDEYLDNL